MAGMKGFEPLHGGFRVHSLTAWLHPNIAYSYIISYSGEVSIKNINFFDFFKISSSCSDLQEIGLSSDNEGRDKIIFFIWSLFESKMIFLWIVVQNPTYRYNMYLK